MTTLICPVRPGDSNEELRYALRSWETNLVPADGLDLITVGYKPTWLDPDYHVEGNKYSSVPLAVFDNVLLGAEAAHAMDLTRVVYMNDDFFCLDPTPGVVPVRRNQTLAEQTAQFPPGVGLWWPRSLLLTASWLDSQGFPHPDSYEVHRPLLASPTGMILALCRWLDSPGGGMNDTVPQWRTIYGVINEVKAHPVKDSKLGIKSTGVGTAWVSTSDESWRRYGRSMAHRFQKPSRWEVTT